MRPALTQRWQFGRAGFVAPARLRACRQLNEPDFFADLRSRRFGRGRWRFGRFNRRWRSRLHLEGFPLDLRFGRFRRRFDDHDGFAGRGFWRRRRRGSKSGGKLGTVLAELLFEIFSADFIERTRRDPGGGNAQGLGFGENFLVLQAKFLRNVVNPNGHKFLSSPNRAGHRSGPNCFQQLSSGHRGSGFISTQLYLPAFGLGARGFQNFRRLFADLRDAAQITFIRRQQILDPRQTGMHQRIGLFA